MMISRIRNSQASGIVATAVLVVDGATKAAAHAALPLCRADCDSPGPVGLLRLENAGSALGFVQGLWIWTLLALLGASLAVFVARRVGPSLRAALASGLLLGGVVGNLVERMLLGGVTDFIAVRGIVLNVADLALGGGAVLATLVLHRLTRPNAAAHT